MGALSWGAPVWAVSEFAPALRPSLGLLSVLLGVLGLMVLGISRSRPELIAVRKAGRLVGAILLVVGLFGGFYSITEVSTRSDVVKWIESYDEGKKLAQATDRPLMVDFTADWCVACQDLDVEVFQHPAIRQRLKTEFIPVKIDYDDGSDDTIEAIERFEVSGLPRVAFETETGQFLPGASFDGTVGVDEFDGRLDQVLSNEDAESGE